ncbi:hypothetical protein ESB00_01735 [Oleiharenicola lentus]|jgi:hypothetical protein|uniref:Uncharacterized protein n=1 Tax=Oleiharenicola lentus TaxID=2508720 RepID=A0A4Q1C6X7_9BACT|nr:hypothetical protein [Oleiharenicola lentus]RXK54643.1 hypothetical protein ESB00_01735 [Oleiharenicola lentus]
MNFRRLARLAAACLLLAFVPLRAGEDNVWPLYVSKADGTTESWQILGPLFFGNTADGYTQEGLRPLYLETTTGETTEGSFLYPFFTWRRQPDFQTFSFFQLLNNRSDYTAGGQADQRFDVWPFWFSRDTGDAETSYRALFPLHGTIKNRFGRDRIRFSAFPLYSHTEKAGRHVTHAPWPFLRFIEGDGHDGFEFWPFYGHVAREGDYERQFWLWPFGYKSVRNLSEPEPTKQFGVLPFYSRETSPGYINENYAWPFFGYSDRTLPYRYHETRWFWPFLVQGRGDDRMVNRWGPFYTHSVIKGTDKTWLLWPLYRNQRWTADGLAQDKTTFLFFLYWSLEQRSPDREVAAAHKTHLWPLFSAWDNGAGRRQVQALSPFEVFFPRNDTVRRLWSPLFALYRFDRQADRSERHALLWNAVTWRRGPEEREFHLGPLAGYRADANERRFALGRGLIGWRRAAGQRWHLFLFDFPSKAAMKADQAASP